MRYFNKLLMKNSLKTINVKAMFANKRQLCNECVKFIIDVIGKQWIKIGAFLPAFLCITWSALVIFLFRSAIFTAPPVPALPLRVPDEETYRPHAAALPEFLRGESAHCPVQSPVHPWPGYLSYCAVYGRWAGTQPADRTSTDSFRSKRVHNNKCKNGYL